MSSPGFDLNRTQLGGPPTADPNRTIMGNAPSLNRTVTIKPVQCPVCRSMNPPGLLYCGDCGLIFELALDGDAFGAPAVQLPALVDSSGKEHRLRPGENILGRQGDIQFEDARVSRRHAKATLSGMEVTVEDLGSTNGTKVAGEMLAPGQSAALPMGAVLSLGGLELTLSMPGESNRTNSPLSGRTTAISAAPTVSDAVAWIIVGDRELPLSRGVHSLGRRAENDIVVPDAYVSGRHGELEADETGVVFTDIGSSNGTLLNGARLAVGQKTLLQPGDVITLGSVELRLRPNP